MKKVLASILAVIYLSSSMGATLHLHYCMGRLMSWGLHDQDSRICSFCGMLKQTPHNSEISSNKCCKDEHKQIKAEKDQKLASSAMETQRISTKECVLVNQPLQVFYISSSVIDRPAVNSPPRVNKVAIILLYCNFRI